MLDLRRSRRAGAGGTNAIHRRGSLLLGQRFSACRPRRSLYEGAQRADGGDAGLGGGETRGPQRRRALRNLNFRKRLPKTAKISFTYRPNLDWLIRAPFFSSQITEQK